MAELILDGAPRAVALSSFDPARLEAVDPACHRDTRAPRLTKQYADITPFGWADQDGSFCRRFGAGTPRYRDIRLWNRLGR